MRMFGRHRAVTRADRVRLADELAEIGMSVRAGEPACCCPAWPVVRVVMAATATRPEPVDLLLCGHHYRAAESALRAAAADVYDASGVLIMGTGRRGARWQQTVAAA